MWVCVCAAKEAKGLLKSDNTRPIQHLDNKIANEAQKTLIRNNFPPQIADRMCAAIDGQEKAELFKRILNENNEWLELFKKLLEMGEKVRRVNQ